MTNQWIEGCAVERVSFRDGLVLKFSQQSELVISVPMRLTLPEMGRYPAEVVDIDVTSVPPSLRPLLDIAGATCTQATWDDDGNLHVELSGGYQIDVPSDAHTTAWELYGTHHGYVACFPGGDMRIALHDAPQGAAAAQGTVAAR